MMHKMGSHLVGKIQLAAVGLLSLLTTCGCTRGRGEEAQKQYTEVVAALKAGSLTGAYASALPPSHDRDLNDLLARARDLVTEDEFLLFKETASRAGQKLAPFLAFAGAQSPAMRVLAQKAKDVPAALGLDTFASFKSRDIKGLLLAIETGLFADVAAADDVKARLESVRVSVVEDQGDWARLRFVTSGKALGGTSGGASGGTSGGTSGAPLEGDAISSAETMDVVCVDGRWVPAGWAADWQGVMDDLRAQLVQAVEAKKQDPEALKKKIRALGLLLENPAPLVESISTRLGEAFGAR